MFQVTFVREQLQPNYPVESSATIKSPCRAFIHVQVTLTIHLLQGLLMGSFEASFQLFSLLQIWLYKKSFVCNYVSIVNLK